MGIVLESGIVLFLAIIALSFLFKSIRPDSSAKKDNEKLQNQISELTNQVKSLKNELEIRDGKSLH